VRKGKFAPGGEFAKKPAHPAPPRGLSAAAKATWATIHQGWSLDDSARELLTVYLEARDRKIAGQALIAQEGMVIPTGKGTRLHPAIAAVEKAEVCMLRAWRQLGLDVAQPGPVGRPGGRGPA
jgi:phage terminase small subunit